MPNQPPTSVPPEAAGRMPVNQGRADNALRAAIAVAAMATPGRVARSGPWTGHDA